MMAHTFSSAVNKWFQTVGIFHINHRDQCSVDPAPGFNAVQTTYDDFKLHIVVFIFVLDLSNVRCDGDSLHSLLHERSGNLGLGFSNISLTE